MQYMILILMLFSDPNKYLNDAVVVEKNGNEFLYFKTEEECYGHIGKNLHVLKEFAVKQYPDGDAIVKDFTCVTKDRIDSLQRST